MSDTDMFMKITSDFHGVKAKLINTANKAARNPGTFFRSGKL
jgi:hypothetical protein